MKPSSIFNLGSSVLTVSWNNELFHAEIFLFVFLLILFHDTLTVILWYVKKREIKRQREKINEKENDLTMLLLLKLLPVNCGGLYDKVEMIFVLWQFLNEKAVCIPRSLLIRDVSNADFWSQVKFYKALELKRDWSWRELYILINDYW